MVKLLLISTVCKGRSRSAELPISASSTHAPHGQLIRLHSRQSRATPRMPVALLAAWFATHCATGWRWCPTAWLPASPIRHETAFLGGFLTDDFSKVRKGRIQNPVSSVSE